MDSILSKVSMDGNIKALRLLLKYGADPNIRLQNPPLLRAAERGNSKCILLLLENGALVDFSGSCGRTALMVASGFGHADIVSTLIKFGADVNLVDKRGNTALAYAACQNHMECLDILLKSNADVNVFLHYGQRQRVKKNKCKGIRKRCKKIE